VAVVERGEDEDPARMSVEACRTELGRELDVNRLRALVAVRRQLVRMEHKRLSGALEISVSAGKVRRVGRPDYIDLT
jgi:hypothetical protein